MEIPLNKDRICRTCLCETDSLICMFDDDAQQSRSISSMISACSDMKVRKNDGLPDKICRKCLELARNAFTFKQQCDIAYRTLRSLAEQYNLNDVTPENANDTTRGTQTDKEDYCRRCSESPRYPKATAKGTEQNCEEPELFDRVVNLQDATDAAPCKSKLNAIDAACKVEAFENVEYLAETFEEVVKKIKNEPNTEDGNATSDTEFNTEQVDFLELEYVVETEEGSINPIKEESSKKSAKGSPGNHKCEYCDKVFRRGTHLRRHILIHTQEKHFKCKICAKAFARSDHLMIHESTFHSKERPFSCQLCEKSFKRAEHLRNHMESKHSEAVTSKKQDFCEVCNKGFTSAKNLELHKKTHLEPKVYKCTYCGEQFAEKNDHRLHVRQLHLEGKSFLCSECGQSFLRNDYLMVHMRRHKGIKPYKCKFCPKAFPRATDLRVHEKYHTNEKPHLCTICGKSFHRAYNLVVHSRTHNGLKPYQCPHCPKSFAQGNDLKAHVRRHTGERYRCDLCNEGFIQGYQLTNHKRTVHNIDSATSTRRVTKFLTPSAQEQQVLLQEQHQQLERLLGQQKALEQQQQEAGWDIERVDHDPDLEKKILETKERIQQVERELEDINNRLHEELELQRYKQQQHQSAQAGVSLLEEDFGEHNRSANSSYGQDFLNDSASALQITESVKDENFTE